MIKGMKVQPKIVGDGTVWRDFVVHAVGNVELRQQFELDTGHDLSKLVNRSPVEALVDDVIGYEENMILAFLDWVTLNHWGVEK